MRHFIRHPADIPIEVSAGNQLVHATRHIHNVSLGGLAFESDGELERRSVRGEAVGGDVEPRAGADGASDRSDCSRLGSRLVGVTTQKRPAGGLLAKNRRAGC